MNELNEAFQIISDFGGDFEGEKDTYLIEKAELALGLKFPPSYFLFLKKLGCGDINGLEFYGLIDDNFDKSSVPNAIWLTLDERKTSNLPDALIIIASSGDGYYYAINTEVKSYGDENPIIMYNPLGEDVYISDSFGEFLLSELKSVL